MAVGDVRQVDGEGRHTTSSRQLLVLPSGGRHRHHEPAGGRLQGGEDALRQAFADVEDLAVAGRFADCAHAGEPGCAVLASVAAGDLAVQRVDSWRRLQRELAFQLRRQDARLQAAERARWRALHRSQRARGGRP